MTGNRILDSKFLPIRRTAEVCTQELSTMNSRVGHDGNDPSTSVGLRALAGVAVALLLTGCASTASEASSDPEASGAGSAAELTQVSRPPAEYGVPVGWEEDNQDNVTHIVDGQSPEQWVEHQSGREAIVQWSVMGPPQSEPSEEQVRAAIDAGLDGMRSATPQEIGYLREATGMGCVGDATVTDPPRTEEVGEGYALRYAYTCPSPSGSARSISITAYGWDGRKHSWTVSTTEDYWEEHAAELEAAADSFRVTD